MNKIFLTFLCLVTVFIFAGTTFASSDVDDSLNNDSIQIFENSNMNITISDDTVVYEKSNNDINNSESNPTHEKTTSFDYSNYNYTQYHNDVKPSESSLFENPAKKLMDKCPKKTSNTAGLKKHDNPKSDNTHPKKPSEITGRVTKFNNTSSNSNSHIPGPKKPLNITGPKKGGSGLDIKGPKMDSKKLELMKLDSILKKYKNGNLTMKLENNSDGKEVIAFYTTSTGLNGAGSSYVGEVGTELVDILEEEGVIHDVAYGTVWCVLHIAKWIDDDTVINDFTLEFLTSGNLSPAISMMWDDFTDDVSDWWDDLWD